MGAGASLRIVFCFFLCLLGCASQGRVLSSEEQSRYGLNGIIYDARICPGSFDPAIQDLKFQEKCEIVNCEPYRGKIVCTAVQE